MASQATKREVEDAVRVVACDAYEALISGNIPIDNMALLRDHFKSATNIIERQPAPIAQTMHEELEQFLHQLQEHARTNPRRAPIGTTMTAGVYQRQLGKFICPVGTDTPGGSSEMVVGRDNLYRVWAAGSRLVWGIDTTSFPTPQDANQTRTDMMLATKTWNKVAEGQLGSGQPAFTWIEENDHTKAAFRVQYSSENPQRPNGTVIAYTWLPGDAPNGQPFYPIVVLSPYLSQNARDRVETLIHETGHNLGFNHEFSATGGRIGVDNPNSIMSYNFGKGLQVSDIDATRSLYTGALNTGYVQIGPVDVATLAPPSF